MKIKDLHKDIDRYLKEDCYCPNEVYDISSIFCMIVEQDDETKKIYQDAKRILSIWEDQILITKIDDKKVIDIIRVDATENNIRELPKWIACGMKTKITLDEHVKGETEKSYEEILSIADAIILNQ
jgi:CRISPR/Cas system-associated endoribonuclease Cas2